MTSQNTGPERDGRPETLKSCSSEGPRGVWIQSKAAILRCGSFFSLSGEPLSFQKKFCHTASPYSSLFECKPSGNAILC